MNENDELNLRNPILLVSGKMGSGKDTIANPLVQELWPDGKIIRMAYADALRDEINHAIDVMRTDLPYRSKIERTRRDLDCNLNEATRLMELLNDPANDDLSLEAHQHVPVIRTALQYWGTQVRRDRDPDYWVDKMETRIIDVLDNDPNAVVVITDGRFPNEVDLIHRLNGVVVRLDIDRDVQVRRIQDRDGITPDPAKLDHVSETALDDYDGFDARVDVSGLTPGEVVESIQNQIQIL